MIRRVLDNDSISLATKYDKTELRKLQLDDPDLKNVILWLETGNKPPQDVIQILSPAAKYFWANASILDIKDGVLHYKWDEGYIIRTLFVVPRDT